MRKWRDTGVFLKSIHYCESIDRVVPTGDIMKHLNQNGTLMRLVLDNLGTIWKSSYGNLSICSESIARLSCGSSTEEYEIFNFYESPEEYSSFCSFLEYIKIWVYQGLYGSGDGQIITDQADKSLGWIWSHTVKTLNLWKPALCFPDFGPQYWIAS